MFKKRFLNIFFKKFIIAFFLFNCALLISCTKNKIQNDQSNNNRSTSNYLDNKEHVKNFKLAKEDKLVTKNNPSKSANQNKQNPQLVIKEANKNANSLVPRTIIALWDKLYEGDIFYTQTHKLAEMPLNFLGFKVEYHDLNDPLPNINKRKDIAGIVCWLAPNYQVKMPELLLKWAIDAIDHGKKFILFGYLEYANAENYRSLMNELWSRIGIYQISDETSLTYDYEISYKDKEIYDFERSLPTVLPPFLNLHLIDKQAKAHLKIRSKSNQELQFPLLVSHPNGAFLMEEYTLYQMRGGNSESYLQKWYINPFKFFSKIFNQNIFPIPDTTTVAGRRSYYSQVDGDGWNNDSLIVYDKAKEPKWSSEVILEEVVLKYPDFPITIAPIAANLDLNWIGTIKSQEIIKKYFRIPYVEMGCHTYSHPFDWQFFADYTTAKEAPYLNNYGDKTYQNSFMGNLKHALRHQEVFYQVQDDEQEEITEAPTKAKSIEQQTKKNYLIPRAYAVKPFNLELETLGAIEEINQFGPLNKKVEVYQWSGDCVPWQEAIEMVTKAHVRNINGGDSRYDFNNPSYAYVAPLTRKLGEAIQVYSSSSNENLYTNLWTTNFYGQITLPTTLKRTETPIRLKPINLYYHMYSGEKLPSLIAVTENLKYARSKKLAPITTSHFSSLVNGYCEVEIYFLAANQWSIQKRGALQTFRFDQATFKQVDFEKSYGIIGQKHFQGSLYIYLDAAIIDPVIALKEQEISYIEPQAKQAYLVDSRWLVWNYKKKANNQISFSTQGFGLGEMQWSMPEPGNYQISVYKELEKPWISFFQATTSFNQLLFTVNTEAYEPIQIKIVKME